MIHQVYMYLHVYVRLQIFLYMSNTITGDVAGPMEGTNVDDSNEGVIHVADDVHKIYPSSPGIKAVHIYRAYICAFYVINRT